MKTKSMIPRLVRASVLFALVVLTGASVGCMTTYDAAGRPVQSVDPGVAVAAAAAAGIVGYGIGNHNDHHYGYYGGRYYRPYYGGGRHYHR